jgi:PAS domain S-box-containing protein
MTAAMYSLDPPDNWRPRRQLTLSPKEMLEELPVFAVLEGMLTPILAVDHDGTVVFANAAFATMVGYSREAVMSLDIGQLMHTRTPSESAVAVTKAQADQIVELCHRDGSSVHARMSKSALLRSDDPVAVVVFHDMTEQIWGGGRRDPRTW